MNKYSPDYIEFIDDEDGEFEDGEFDNIEVDEEEIDYVELDRNTEDEKEYLGYTRQSKAGNSELTFGAQKKAIKKYARDNKLKLSKENIFEEEKSGYVSGKRVLFEKMILTLEEDSKRENKKYGGVIFFDVSRMARNGEDFIRIEKLYRQGYKFISIKENIVDSAAGMYFFRMICNESIFYSDRQSSKATQYGLYLINKNNYAYLGGNSIQYGYRIKKYGKDKSDIEINPFHAKIIKRIYELNYEGLKHKIIAETIQSEFKEECEKLNRERRKQEQIYTIPRDEKSISKILLNKERIRFNGKRYVVIDIKFEDDVKILESFYNKPKGIKKGRNILIFETPKLRIIDDELYNNVLWKNSERQHRKLDIGNYDGALYSNTLKCVCGGAITGQRGGNGNKYRYMCSNARNNTGCDRKTIVLEEQIDNYVNKEIIQFLNIEPIFDVVFDLVKGQELSRISDTIKSARIKLASKEKKLDALKEEMESVNFLYDSKNPDAELNLKYRIPQLIMEIKEIKGELQLLEEEKARNEKDLKDDLLKMNEVILRYKELSKDLKKHIVDEVIGKIVIDEEKDETKKYRNPKDKVSKGGFQKQIINIDLMGDYRIFYKLNKMLGKQQ